MSLQKFLRSFGCGILIWLAITATPVYGQLPTIQDLVLYSNNVLHNSSRDKLAISCIRLDGRCAFKIAFPKSGLSQRANEIQYRLNEIKRIYLQQATSNFQVSSQNKENSSDIYVTINSDRIKLLSITTQDAVFQGLTLESKAEVIVAQLETRLIQVREQRKSRYLIRQGIISLIILIVTILASFLLRYLAQKLRKIKQEINSSPARLKLPLADYLAKRNSYLTSDIKHRLLQLSQFLLWLVGILVILGLFPQTRTLQLLIFTGIRLPLRIIIVGIATYLLIRLIYKLINDIGSSIVAGQFVLSPRANKRLELRVNTIALVTKGIIAFFLTTSGFLLSLAVVGIDITPFLAGAGIIGLALSFASQSFIKDALNGFLIIFEDQYAVGDVINLNGVGGMVENINLRITQIRDAEGRLITIPNSEVKIVANLSSQWSRADLFIPLSYDVDIDLALAVITRVANQMSEDESWQQFIIEPPIILGVENFSDRGIVIRLFIKTEPLKQFEVSREFRRRLHIALKEADIPLAPPQQQILIKENENIK